jgi:hypothetical protein
MTSTPGSSPQPSPSLTEQEAQVAVDQACEQLAKALQQQRTVRGEPEDEACEYCDGTGVHPLGEVFGGQKGNPCERCKGSGRVARTFPWIVERVAFEGKPLQPSLRRGTSWVRVRPCAPEYERKTYLGFLLGDLALSHSVRFKRDGTLCVAFSMHNPAIFVPTLGKLLYGCELWWSKISSPDDLRTISDADIDNVWYVQALKSLQAATSDGRETA